jgi:hypothetical protein
LNFPAPFVESITFTDSVEQQPIGSTPNFGESAGAEKAVSDAMQELVQHPVEESAKPHYPNYHEK